MLRCFTLALVLLGSALVPPAFAGHGLSDDEIRARLLGNWVTVYDQKKVPDYLLIRFSEGGTARAWFFKEPECKTVLYRTDLRWRVEGGVLITTYPENFSDHDVVEKLTDDAATFRSVERRGKPYTRFRSTGCKPPKE